MKKVVYLVFGIAALYFLLAFFAPSESKIERHISINQPLSIVKEKVGDFAYFHNYWSPWTEKDPSMLVTYKGNPGEIGHYYSWSGNKDVGKGEMEIIFNSRDSIVIRLVFGEEEEESKTYYILNEENNGTKVTWLQISPISFLSRTPMLLVNLDKKLGSEFEKGLSNLKQELEGKEGIAEKFEIKELVWEEANYIGRKETVSFSNLDKYFEDNFGLLLLILEKNNIKNHSPPSALFFSYDDVNQITDVSSAYRVPKGTVIKGWEVFTFPAAHVLSVAFKGDPSTSGAAHAAIAEYLQEKTLDYSMVIEEYQVAPEQVTKRSDCVTNIYYLLKPKFSITLGK